MKPTSIRLPSLYEELRDVPALHAAALLGLRVGRGWFGPCPACGAAARGAEDRRGPCGVRRDGRGWQCHRCQAGGDVAALVAAVELGTPAPAGADRWARVRARAERVGLVGAEPGAAPAVPVPAPEPARTYPPAGEVAGLWQACRPVERVEAVCAWLAGRGIDARGVALHDYARVCPAAAWRGWPSWARTAGRTWGEGWQLVLPAWGVGGELVTLRARWTLAEPAPGGRKEIAPAGYTTAGACYATPQARGLLAGRPWPAPLVIVEGGPSWLRYALEAAAKERPPAVVGLWSGSWSDDLAERLAGAERWIVATDDDDAGDRYAAPVLRDAERFGVRAQRWRAGR